MMLHYSLVGVSANFNQMLQVGLITRGLIHDLRRRSGAVMTLLCRAVLRARKGAKRFKPGPERQVAHQLQTGVRVEHPKVLLLKLDKFRERYKCEPEDLGQKRLTVKDADGKYYTGVPYLKPGQDPDALVVRGFSEVSAVKTSLLDSSKEHYRPKPKSMSMSSAF